LTNKIFGDVEKDNNKSWQISPDKINIFKDQLKDVKLVVDTKGYKEIKSRPIKPIHIRLRSTSNIKCNEYYFFDEDKEEFFLVEN
jgi:CRISPR/Cas system CSM-associated protein Csm4 (group 5 of RAMP superfamily)